MSQTLEPSDIDKLSVADRLELIARIWDSLPATEPPVPEWHLAELRRRRAEAEADPTAAVPWEEVRARLTRPR